MTTGSGFFVVIFQCFGQISDSPAVTPTKAKKSTGEAVAEESESSTNNVPTSKVSIPHPTISFSSELISPTFCLKEIFFSESNASQSLTTPPKGHYCSCFSYLCSQRNVFLLSLSLFPNQNSDHTRHERTTMCIFTLTQAYGVKAPTRQPVFDLELYCLL
jgi:hypothetical protein